jgi:hypothetical protein
MTGLETITPQHVVALLAGSSVLSALLVKLIDWARGSTHDSLANDAQKAKNEATMQTVYRQMIEDLSAQVERLKQQIIDSDAACERRLNRLQERVRVLEAANRAGAAQSSAK